MKRFLVTLLVLTAACAGIIFLYREYYERFSVENIHYEKLFTGPSGADDALAEELLMGKKFTYVGKGHQSYVFAIEGTPYVIKFVRFNYLKPTPLDRLLERLPLVGESFEREQEAKEKRFWRVFQGYRTAFQKSTPSGGLLYIHLTKGPLAGLEIDVTDGIGATHKVKLDETAFVIQKRAIPTRDVFNALMHEGRVDLVKARIRSLFDMYMADYKASLYDDDHNLLINTGFAGDTPVRMDLGKVKESRQIADPVHYEPDLTKIAQKRLYPWFKRYYPQQSEEIRRDMEDKLSQLFGKKVSLHG